MAEMFTVSEAKVIRKVESDGTLVPFVRLNVSSPLGASKTIELRESVFNQMDDAELENFIMAELDRLNRALML